MKNIVLVCLFAFLLSGCNMSEKEMIDLVSSYKASEGQPISAEVVKVGETLPQTNLIYITVRLGQGHFRNVLSNEKLSVGQRVKLIGVYYQSDTSSTTAFVSYYTVVVPKE